VQNLPQDLPHNGALCTRYATALRISRRSRSVEPPQIPTRSGSARA